MRTALIFGASGQDGYYLSQHCRERGINAIGSARSAGKWIQGDVADRGFVDALVREHKPDYLFQLAANSTTRHAALFDNHAAIATGTLNVLEAAKQFAPQARIFIPGSGVMFKNEGRPISERDAFEPSSPYAVARIHAVQAARYYRTLGLHTYVGHLFHHESPLRKPGHVSRMIADAARNASDISAMLEIGDITVEKEWSFAGDIAAGMLTLLEQDRVTEAAIGSGCAYSIAQWLEACFGCVDRDWHRHVTVRNDFVPEYRRLVADPATINSLGWSCKVSLEELAKMMVAAQPRD